MKDFKHPLFDEVLYFNKLGSTSSKAERLLKDIEKEIGKIAESAIEAIPSNTFNDETVSFLNDSIHIAFFYLNKIHTDVKNIKKNNRSKSLKIC